MLDGIPLNDAGNYATYAGERIDSEALASVNVITGSSEVDAPSASSLGGTVNYNSINPTDKFGGLLDLSGGSFGEHRFAGLINSGEIGPYGTKAWIEGSYAENNKWTGVGNDWKWQINGKVYQDLHHDGDFVSAAFFYDREVFGEYDGVDFAPAGTTGTTFHGLLSTPYNYDYNKYYSSCAPTSSSCYFQGVELNPTYTGNIRGASRFTILPDLKLTVDPSYQWVLANGGGSTLLSGTSRYLIGPGTLTSNQSSFPACTNASGQITGLDLNGATGAGGTPVCTGSARFLSPSNTQTDRFTVNTDLIWTPTPQHLFQLAYAYDHGNVHQSGDYGLLNANGFPASVFGGLQGWGSPLIAADGTTVEKRNQLTIADLNQVSLEYVGKYFDDHLRIDLGVRDPFMTRELNQYCYTKPVSTEYCTATAAAAVSLAGTANLVAPYTLNLSYSKVLPNVGFTWRFDQKNSVFADYTEALNAPSNFDLYSIGLIGTGGSTTTTPGADTVQPEVTQTIEGGYRYQTSLLQVTVDGYAIEDQNHIVSSYNQLTQDSVDTNVGTVNFWGFEGLVGWKPIDHLTLIGSLSYEHSEVMSNIQYSSTYTILTGGKQFYDTPPWTLSGRATYDWNAFTFGGQMKYVDARYVTGVNDLQVPSYVTFDMDVRYKLDWVRPGTFVQLNVINLFNEKYIGSINYGQTNNSSSPAYSSLYAYAGAPTTVQVTLRATF
jgi:iron complex outermembrane receptor protein